MGTTNIVKQVRICRRWKFAAAHLLPKVPAGHKCSRLHGHNYTVDVVVQGDVGDDGMVCDYADLDTIWRPIAGLLDHRYLNDVEGLLNPTSENIAAWILERFVRSSRVLVVKVRVAETKKSWAEVWNASYTQHFGERAP